MTDPCDAPRRVSLGYILGFSDKPFKDPKSTMPPSSPPRPRKPSQLTSLVSSPGGLVEWTASDGRKGRLRETGKLRLTATSLAKVPSEDQCMKDALDAKSGSNKAADHVKGAENKDGKAAADAVLNKAKQECKAICTKPHPDNSDSNCAKKKDGKGDGGKKKKAKGENRDQNQCGNQSEKKNKKEEDRKGEHLTDSWGGGIGGVILDQIDDKKDEPNEANANIGAWDTQGGTEGENPKDIGIAWDVLGGGGVGDNKDAVNPWDTVPGGGDGGATTSLDAKKSQNDTAAEGGLAPNWDSTVPQDNNNNTGGGFQPLNNETLSAANKPASTSRSNKAPSQSHSYCSIPSNRKPAPNRPLELEIKPDDVFSADDLRHVARILQQDCSMVWNRVSWRFRDKTGRTLHPDVFEKKIVGQLEGNGSERGERRR